MQHNWQIIKLSKQNINDIQNVVTSIEWKLTTSFNEHEVSVGKIQPINFDPSVPFIDYNNLTESAVLEWLFESMGERKQMFEDQTIANINKKLSSVPNTLPWQS